MSATMIDMELVFADKLTADQLMENDIIHYDGEYVVVKNIQETKTGYLVATENDFGEEFEIEASDDTKFSWYVYIE